jgi:hypothetical protein
MMKLWTAALYFLLAPFACHALDLEDPASYFQSLEDDEKAVYQNWIEERLALYASHTFLPTVADPDNGAAVFWKIHTETDTAVSRSGSNNGHWIQFAVAVRATGWVGFGISEAGGMLGSDVALFRAAEPDTLVDAYIVEERFPLTDSCQHWELVAAIIEEGWMIVEMRRLLDTEDPQDHRIVNDSPIYFAPSRLISAWGDGPNVIFHGLSRAKGAVKLFGDSIPFNRKAQETNYTYDGYFDIRKSNYAIPEKETKYHSLCKTYYELQAEFGFPENETLGVIEGKAIITEETAPFIHHFIVYGSSSKSSCDNSYQIMFAWAPGEDGMILPDNVALPVFGDSQINSLRIEIHYNNPELVSGLSDSSGLRFFYSLEPREHDAGWLSLGDPVVALSGEPIGEGLSEWSFTCAGTCSALALLNGPVTVFSESLHMHKTGARMTNEVIRNNRVVHTAAVEVFEYDAQGSPRVQQDTFQIKAGDGFRTTCYYRDGDQFGMSSQQEMCIAFLLYYPAKTLGFGDQQFAWSCYYGIGTSICNEVLDEAKLASEDELGRLFGKPADVCTSLASGAAEPSPGLSLTDDPDAPTSPTEGSESASGFKARTTSSFIVAVLVFCVYFLG